MWTCWVRNVRWEATVMLLCAYMSEPIFLHSHWMKWLRDCKKGWLSPAPSRGVSLLPLLPTPPPPSVRSSHYLTVTGGGWTVDGLANPDLSLLHRSVFTTVVRSNATLQLEPKQTTCPPHTLLPSVVDKTPSLGQQLTPNPKGDKK